MSKIVPKKASKGPKGEAGDHPLGGGKEETGVGARRSLSHWCSTLPERLRPWREFIRRVAEATSFLARARLVSPCEDMSQLLETHLISQTARNAVERCKNLTTFNMLEDSCAAMMANYTAFLKTSSDYLRLQTFRLERYTLALGLVSIVIALIITLG